MSDMAPLTAAISCADALVRAVAPDDGSAAEGIDYVGRLAAGCLADALLGHLFQRDGLLRALPVRGGPNPDYRMLHAGIDPEGRYRLTGRLNAAERIGIGLYAPAAGAIVELGYRIVDRASLDAAGGFTIDLAAGAEGADTLALRPECRMLLVRILERDRAGSPAEILLEGPLPAPTLAPRGGNRAAAVARAAETALANVVEYLRWTSAVLETPNRLVAPPAHLAQAVNAEPATQYFLGAFDLVEDQFLEIDMPAGLTGYWSVHAYNLWFEHLLTPGVHDANCRPDDAGRIIVRIGDGAPALTNWIDTRARRRGALICRIVDAPPLEAALRCRLVRDRTQATEAP